MRASNPAVRRRVGPLFLLLPFLFFVLALGHLLRRPERGEPAPPPHTSDPEEHVAAWRGELAGSGGTWLEATLTPLYPEPERLEFESRALARRLGLGPGRAWRLRVLWGASDAAAGAAAGAPGALGEHGPGGAEAPARARPAGIGLGAVEVLDASGTALASLPPPQPGAGAADPLAVLVAPPAGALRPGQAADWILWGRAPEGTARLTGLVPEDDAAFRAATGLSGALELRAVSVRRGDLDEPLARLERPALGGGKTDARASSDGQRGEGNDL